MSRFTLLDRISATASCSTPLQSQVEGLVGGFTEQATDWRSLASMFAGGCAYRVGRIGVMGLGSGSALRAASVGLGLGAEVSAFELSHRSLESLHSSNRVSSNLWRWSGSGGLRQGLLQSLVSFGALKGAGRLAQGENLIAQHLLQDSAMVLGHQATAALGIAPRPADSLMEQFLHAEALNLQIGAGMALAHGLAPALHGLERGLDLSLSRPSAEGGARGGREAAWALALAGDRVLKPREEAKGPDRLFMSDTSDGKGPRGRETLVDLSPESGERAWQLEDGKVRLVQGAVLDEAGRYFVIKYLGSGGFADVYLVRDTKFAREMVAKIPNKERFDGGTLARFRQEGIIGGSLDPQFAARVSDVVELRREITDALRNTTRAASSKEEPLAVPIMDYVAGHDLSTLLYYLSDNRPEYAQKYSLERRVELFAEICLAVHSAHEKGVLHRDLKPENIRVTPDLRVRVMDWGQAKLSKEPSDPPPASSSYPPLESLIETQGGFPQTLHGFVSGTPGYIPPEAMEGRPPTRKTDIFALGMLGYQMFSLRHPHTVYRKGDPAKGEPALVPQRNRENVTDIDEQHWWLWKDPPSFAEIAPGDHPAYFYAAEEIFRRAFDPDEEGRYETALELREEILWVRARTDFVRIQKIREEMAKIHRQMVEDHRHFSVGVQTPSEQWDAMHEPLEELKQMRKEWRKMAGDLITHLTGRIPLLSHPDTGRAMISELNLMLYLDEGDRAPKRVREDYIRAIEENEVVVNEGLGFGCAAAINGATPISLIAEDWVTGRPVEPANLRIDVFPLEREVNDKNRESGNYRVGKPLHRGSFSLLENGFELAPGYYALVLSHPIYAPFRLPLRVSVEDVRRYYQYGSSFPLRLQFIPKDQVPDGFAVVHGGVATLGHDFYEEGVPTKVWSRPQFLESYDTFLAAMKPVSVGEYFEFIQHKLDQINTLIAQGDFVQAWHDALRVREYLPRRRQIIPSLPGHLLDMATPAYAKHAFTETLSNLDLYWRVRVESEAASGGFRFVIDDPSTHPDPNGDPIYLDQPITAESNLGAEAYTRWRAERDGHDYYILSADQNEVIARNGFPWYYPWGYRFSPSFTVTRTSFRDPNNDSFPQRIGTHPQGRRAYRDRSLFGPVDVVGNGRKFTGTRDEPETVVLVGGGPRNPPGPYFDPWGRTSMPRNWADQSNGVFRLGLNPRRNK